MKLTTLALVSAALGSAGLSACHHGGTYAASPRDTTYVSTHIVTTTTTTSGGDVAYTTDTTGSTSATTTSATTTSAMSSSAMPSSDATRNSRSNMRAERREVYDAMRSLRHARYELEHAPHDFGGRRPDAIRAVDAALRELRLAAGEESVERRAVEGTPREERAATADRQDLRQAIASLERARNDIEHAPHDYGGRKTAALESTDHALQELRLAVEHEK